MLHAARRGWRLRIFWLACAGGGWRPHAGLCGLLFSPPSPRCVLSPLERVGKTARLLRLRRAAQGRSSLVCSRLPRTHGRVGSAGCGTGIVRHRSRYGRRCFCHGDHSFIRGIFSSAVSFFVNMLLFTTLYYYWFSSSTTAGILFIPFLLLPAATFSMLLRHGAWFGVDQRITRPFRVGGLDLAPAPRCGGRDEDETTAETSARTSLVCFATAKGTKAALPMVV